MKFTLGINILNFQHLNNVEKALKKHIIHL